jgi:hypothetical protein
MSSNWGGKRDRAGRKQSAVEDLKNKTLAALADEVFDGFDKVEAWREILKDADLKTKLDALKYLEDRQNGRPIAKTQIDATHTHAVYDAGKLADLTDDELSRLDLITRKVAVPGGDRS